MLRKGILLTVPSKHQEIQNGGELTPSLFVKQPPCNNQVYRNYSYSKLILIY